MPWQRMHSLLFAEVRIFIFHSTVTKYTFQYVKEIIVIWFAMQWSRNTQKTLGLPLFVIMSIRLFQHYNQDVHDFALLLLMQCMSQNDLNMSLLLKGKFYTSFFQLALSIFNLVLSKLELVCFWSHGLLHRCGGFVKFVLITTYCTVGFSFVFPHLEGFCSIDMSIYLKSTMTLRTTALEPIRG